MDDTPRPGDAAAPARLKRASPMLEHDGDTRQLDVAPAPWIVRQCTESGLVFLENPPGYESLKSELAWEVTWKREAEARAAAEPVLYAASTAVKSFRKQVMKRHKVADMATDIARHCTSDPINLLDLGCGGGQLLGMVMERLPAAVRARCRPIGVEISNELAQRSAAALAPYGGRCVHASALEGMAGLEAGSLDLIVMSSFLEHEIQPLPLLREARRSLRDDGHVLVKVPNYASWNRVLRGRRWCGYRWPDHVNYFTPATLGAMAAKAGLRVDRMSLFDRFPLSDSLYAVLRKAGIGR
jgi:SAM-dependent methyltransferase